MAAVGEGTGSFVGAGIGSCVGAGIGSCVGAGIGSFVGAGIGSFFAGLWLKQMILSQRRGKARENVSNGRGC